MKMLYQKITLPCVNPYPLDLFYGHGFLMSIFAAMALSLCFHGAAFSQEKVASGLRLTRAVICEDIKDGQTVNEGAIFSSDLGRITCYTEFDSIPEKTTIYHRWYFKENVITKKMPLVLNPPRWSTFSQIQPRDTDKGPWRVEIVDQDGTILQTLRFSIID
jgi:hypothetical protein